MSDINLSPNVAFDFSDARWHRFSQQRTQNLGVAPNELWSHAEAKLGALVVRESKYPEFAVSKTGLEYLQTVVRDGKITDGFVVLARWNDEILAMKSVAEVAAALVKVPPRTGRLGPYWWHHPDLVPCDQHPF